MLYNTQKMAPIERRSLITSPTYFITTAYGKAGKAELAQEAGYELLPPHLKFIAAEAGRREDLYAEHMRLRVAAHHYPNKSEIPNTVQAAANKAEGVLWCYEQLVHNNPEEARLLARRDFEVMDNQMLVVDTMGHKVGLKKPRNDTLQHLQEDILKLIDIMKRGSEDGSHIEYFSAFVRGVFGNQTIMEYKTVRTIVGTILKDINLELMGQFMMKNLHSTGALNIEELVSYFIEASGIDIKIREYHEGNRHYEGMIVIIDQLVKQYEKVIFLSHDYAMNKNLFPAIVRGFL